MKNFIFGLNKEERKKMNRHLLDENYNTWCKCGYVIGLFQVAMLISNITGAQSPRTPYYRRMYLGLLLATIIAEVVMNYCYRHEEAIDGFYAFAGMYMFTVFLWSMGITYIGFSAHQDLSTFAYATIAVCAIVLLEPYLVSLMLIGCTYVLGALIFSNPELHAGFGTMVQLLSICILAMIVSSVAYNRRLARVRLEYAQANSLEEISKLNQQLKHDATMDALTGLYNRRFLTEHIDQKLVTGKVATGVLMIDIDYFKKINDTYGHQIGDECLVILGKLIKEISQEESDCAIRYGGEEFLVTYARIKEEDLIAKAVKLQDLLNENPLHENDTIIPITVSIGYAIAHEEMKFTDLIGIADKNLYQAKENGRNLIWPDIHRV